MQQKFRVPSKIIVTGWVARLAAAPFLLQWFHPDERQVLEFAHRLAHPVSLNSPLQIFLESELHLRNQTLPMLYSWIIQGLDFIGLATPHAYLTALYVILGSLSWLALLKLIETFAQQRADNPPLLPGRRAIQLAWVFALFWPFVVIYPRALLESVSLTAALFGLSFFTVRRFGWAGFFLAVAGMLRYPSILFLLGGALLYTSQLKQNKATLFKDVCWGTLGVGAGVVLMGISDYKIYGNFFESASQYWGFNRPNGPVETQFGRDDLSVYLKWFEFVATPWLAPFLLALSLLALARTRVLMLFTLPYIIGHLWTAHREPRFMIPLMPFFFLAIAIQWDVLIKKIPHKWIPWAGNLVFAHWGIAVLWTPLYLWGQTQTGLGQVLLRQHELRSQPTLLINHADPMIDALLPSDTTLKSPEGLLLRGSNAQPVRTWHLTATPQPGCTPIFKSHFAYLPQVGSPHWERILRAHLASFYHCP